MKLWRGHPFKKLTKGLRQKAGRNTSGKITVYHRGSGVSRLYRFIDFKRSLWGLNAYIKRLEYDPNRSGYIALILYENGIISYILAADNSTYDSIIKTGSDIKLGINNAKPLYTIPLGLKIFNLEYKLGKGGILKRSAGTAAQILKKNLGTKHAVIKISKKYELILNYICLSTLGRVSNVNHEFKKYKKAGSLRLLGKRPHVRGVAMNPIDHPHGGGEGKTSGGRCSVSRWGWLTKGYKTLKKK